MLHAQPPFPKDRTAAWLDRLFSAQAVAKGDIVRRSIAYVEREVGRGPFVDAVRARGFHLIECGSQFIVICNTGLMRVVC